MGEPMSQPDQHRPDPMDVLLEIAQFVRGVGGYPVPEPDPRPVRSSSDMVREDRGWVVITLTYGLTRRLFAAIEPVEDDDNPRNRNTPPGGIGGDVNDWSQRSVESRRLEEAEVLVEALLRLGEIRKGCWCVAEWVEQPTLIAARRFLAEGNDA